MGQRKRSLDCDRLAKQGYAYNLLRGTWHPPECFGRKRTKFHWREVLLDNPCVYCGNHIRKRKHKGLDHIAPKSKGGYNGWYNRAPACRSCDSRKGSESLLLFLIRRRKEQGNAIHNQSQG